MMKNLFSGLGGKSPSDRAARQASRRRNGQDVNRRNFLQLESLETRWALATVATAMNDVYHTPIDAPLTISSPGVLANDISSAGQPMSAALFSGPAHGELTFNPDGSFVYTPAAGFEGMDSFVYSASDGESSSLLAAVTITVSEGTEPVSADDAYLLSEDSSLTIPGVTGVLANDASAVGATVELISGPDSGALTLGSDGGFIYTPEPNFSGVVNFTYQATNSNGTGNISTVTLTVAAVNDEPVAANDSFTIDEDQTLSVTESVLTNDSDIEGSALAPQLASQPLHGTVSFNADGTFTYQPHADFNGIDGFSYLVNDGQSNSEVATVTITVNPINDAPIAVNDEYSIDEDQPLEVTGTGVLGNDSDIDNTSLTATIVQGPLHGTVTLNADGSFVYTPAQDFFGVDGFSYTAGDGSLASDVATVTINVAPVNDSPVAVNDEYTTAEDTELVIEAPGVMLNDLDPDGGELTVQIVSPPLHGTVTLGADGRVAYMPTADYHGLDGFSYTVSDGTTTSDVATVTVNITPVNDAPIAANDEYNATEDTPLVISTDGILANDGDVDGDALTATIISQPQYGTVALNADGTFSYTPIADFSGVDGFSYTVSDGSATSDVATVTLNAAPVNDTPVGVADAYTVAEDGSLDVGEGGVLANDSDVDSADLTATLATGPANGTVSFNADGTFVYTPNANFNGSDSFTYKVSDGELESGETTVSIEVTPGNDVPVASADEYATDENQSLEISAPGVLGNDSDVDADALTAAIVSGPTNGTLEMAADGSFVYTPNPGFAGSDSFVYAASDGTANSEAIVTITVNDVIQPPATNSDAYSMGEDMSLEIDASWGVLANDFDPQSTSMTAEIVTEPEHGQLVLEASGAFQYVPDADFHGTDSFTYRAVNAAGEMTEGVATIVVEALNDAPQAIDDAFTVAAGSTLQTTVETGVQANDWDVDTDSESTQTGNIPSANLLQGPQHGSLVFNADGSFTYTPTAGFTGTDSFAYQLNDGIANSQVAHATITVTGESGGGEVEVNVAPVSTADAYATTVDQTLTVNSPGVLSNDSDANEHALTAQLVTNATNGQVTLAGDGSFVYVPNAGFIGSDSFTYFAHDGSLASEPVTVTLQVQAAGTNTRPTVNNDLYLVAGNSPFSVTGAGVLANDSDAQNDALVANLFAGPQHGTVVLNSDGGFTYTPEDGYVGMDSFLYWASDGLLGSSLAAVTLRVTAPASVEAEDAFATLPLTLDDGSAADEFSAAVDCVLLTSDWLA
ncbi:hypothetical protein ETAA8_11530 [Anatilimnocola aggregata]|uniref:Tandem-95 repeat protein n=1 Tax=Anatilimnocola aggregata TaxID=2528021 RepID=A0A517Y765_9BACT|nr:Ig-like domain-containing protein [Anatilimnocola aggregata]QDU26079.1 hypothetical protein ETAA8_11530 [Anatilimnocola aggregata]